jgi:beta-xylosidase
MSSTTMHMSPGLPIMSSKDLVNWKLVSYAYNTLDENNSDLNLENGKNAYGKGSWASSFRYHNGTYYVSTFASTTGKTYIYTTKNIEKGPWKEISFKPSFHDHSLFFDDDGKVYLVYGAGKIMITELNADLTGIKEGTTPQVLIQNAALPVGTRGLAAEGSQLFKVNGKYYLYNINWPSGDMRQVLIHRADKITGPYDDGRIAFHDQGIAQGGMINTPKGDWYAYLFQDHGAVGRIPYLVPIKWEDGWPVIGVEGKSPATLDLPVSKGLMPNIVNSDEFSRKKGEAPLSLVWQWNHNPDNKLWSLTQRPGYLRLTTGRVDADILQARNTLTQRTFGPTSSGATSVDVSNMKDGDVAGLLLLQKKYGWVGVKVNGDTKSIVMVNVETNAPVEVANIPLTQKTVYFKADCDFTNKTDKAYFYYSLDGKTWTPIGSTLKMSYTLPHFMGYRFGLFNYATKTTGGYADFDFLRLSDKINIK